MKIQIIHIVIIPYIYEMISVFNESMIHIEQWVK